MSYCCLMTWKLIDSIVIRKSKEYRYFCYRMIGSAHRLNMEVDLQSLFGFHVTWCAQLYSLAETPQLPPSPRIWTRIRGALLVSKDRRHLYITPRFRRPPSGNIRTLYGINCEQVALYVLHKERKNKRMMGGGGVGIVALSAEGRRVSRRSQFQRRKLSV